MRGIAGIMEKLASGGDARGGDLAAGVRASPAGSQTERWPPARRPTAPSGGTAGGFPRGTPPGEEPLAGEEKSDSGPTAAKADGSERVWTVRAADIAYWWAWWLPK